MIKQTITIVKKLTRIMKKIKRLKNNPSKSEKYKSELNKKHKKIVVENNTHTEKLR